MVITQKQYQAAYTVAKDFFAGKTSISIARKTLSKLGMNQNTATALVYGLKHMLEGKVYKRALSEGATNDYLHWILRDFGSEAHRNAVLAVGKHLGYRQESGVSLPGLRDVLNEHTRIATGNQTFFVSPEENDAAFANLKEGRLRAVLVNVYERSLEARERCIRRHGSICAVCGFEFEQVYGPRGQGFIHIHHLRSIAALGKEHNVDPENDLRPVCPNCHAMLHVEPACTIEMLKELIQMQRSRRQI